MEQAKKENTIHICSATVIEYRQQPDTILLLTDLPSPIYPFSATLALKFTAPEGTGLKYVEEVLRIESIIRVKN